MLAPGEGKTRIDRLWGYVRDDRPAGDSAPPAVWFRYSADRKGEHAQRHLRDFHGILQANAYGGWNALYDGGHVIEAACWAHARRPWWDLYEQQRDDTGLAAQALRHTQGLYAVEADIRGSPPGVRRQQRQARAAPLLEAFHRWLQGVPPLVSTKSELAKAARYSLARWKALTRDVDDGRIEIDNSTAERALRGVALGRGNYLFMGSNAGGERAASMYSLIETAKLNGLDPEAYLRDVLQRIADHPVNRIDELLPWSIAAQQALPRAGPWPWQHSSMAEDDIASRMVEALQDAPSMQLYQMRALIDVLLDDPKREMAARMKLHLGQAVQFIDHRTGQVRHGKLIARHKKQATVLEEDVRRTWKIPYVAIDSLSSEPGVQVYEPPPEPAGQTANATFKVGDKVTFDDGKGVAQVGMVTRINRRTATLQAMDGRNWRVGFELLRHVLDV